MKSSGVLVPDYYPHFRCIGPACEDSCCFGWAVPIDRDTYHSYKQNRHKLLEPLFREAVRRNPHKNTQGNSQFAFMAMKADGSCAFLQDDSLCAIHTHLGEGALCDTCALFPRHTNRFGAQLERSLDVSCPEAARLVLLHPEPIAFTTVGSDPSVGGRGFISDCFPKGDDSRPEQIALSNDFRALIIGILQCREMRIGSRLMLLGLLLEKADEILPSGQFSDMGQLAPLMESFAGLLRQAATVESQFLEIASNLSFRLHTIARVLSQSMEGENSQQFIACLRDAMGGLIPVETAAEESHAGVVARYTSAYRDYYRPFFLEREYILENYLVNHVISRLFPFLGTSFLESYRELVCNLSIAQTLLVGMAAHHRGLDEGLAVKLLQSFTRKSAHNVSYAAMLLQTIRAEGHDSLLHMMWMLREADD
jgi:lysine-N-methylase